MYGYKIKVLMAVDKALTDVGRITLIHTHSEFQHWCNYRKCRACQWLISSCSALMAVRLCPATPHHQDMVHTLKPHSIINLPPTDTFFTT